MERNEIKCGEIYWLEAKGAVGHQYSKKRPHLVVDSDEYIKISNMVCAVPLTTNMANRNRFDFEIIKNTNNRLRFNSLAKLDHIYTYDKGQFVCRIGHVDLKVMQGIHYFLRKHFNS